MGGHWPRAVNYSRSVAWCRPSCDHTDENALLGEVPVESSSLNLFPSGQHWWHRPFSLKPVSWYLSIRGSVRLSFISHMALRAGDRLGLFAIVALIGKGGMGEVYRARDTKLKRDVLVDQMGVKYCPNFDENFSPVPPLKGGIAF